MSAQLQPPESLVKTEPLAVIKNEPPESEIGMDDTIPDIKDIDIVSHSLCEELLKSETVPEDILETKHSEFVETQVFVETQNVPFVKIENIFQSEILNKTEDTNDGNVRKGTGQGVVEVQGSNEEFVSNFSSDLNGSSRKPEHPKETDFGARHRICEATLWQVEKEKIKIIKAPKIPVEPHEYTSFAKDKHVCNHCQYASNSLQYIKCHIEKRHRKVTTKYQCPHCPFRSKWSIRNHVIQRHTGIQSKLCPVCGKGFKTGSSKINQISFVHNKKERYKVERKCPECEYTTTNSHLLRSHINTHKKFEARRCCDKCDYSTFWRQRFNKHILIHLEPTKYFYCYRCSYKSKYKSTLKSHIMWHCKNGEIKHKKRYHCNKCNYKAYTRQILNSHKLIHLNPEKIQYVYCYHCSFKSKKKENLKTHILNHFKNGKVVSQ